MENRMPFEQYYHTPVSTYIVQALLWGGIIGAVWGLVVSRIGLPDPAMKRRAVRNGIIWGFVMGAVGGGVLAGHADQDINASILQRNIEKKYDIQSVTFDFTTTKGGGHGWTPTRSKPQQVVVEVDNVSRIATLTQDPATAEPTLVDVETNQELMLNDTSE
jgi:hypothetical protein